MHAPLKSLPGLGKPQEIANHQTANLKRHGMDNPNSQAPSWGQNPNGGRCEEHYQIIMWLWLSFAKGWASARHIYENPHVDIIAHQWRTNCLDSQGGNRRTRWGESGVQPTGVHQYEKGRVRASERSAVRGFLRLPPPNFLEKRPVAALNVIKGQKLGRWAGDLELGDTHEATHWVILQQVEWRGRPTSLGRLRPDFRRSCKRGSWKLERRRSSNWQSGTESVPLTYFDFRVGSTAPSRSSTVLHHKVSNCALPQNNNDQSSCANGSRRSAVQWPVLRMMVSMANCRTQQSEELSWLRCLQRWQCDNVRYGTVPSLLKMEQGCCASLSNLPFGSWLVGRWALGVILVWEQVTFWTSRGFLHSLFFNYACLPPSGLPGILLPFQRSLLVPCLPILRGESDSCPFLTTSDSRWKLVLSLFFP